MKLEIVMPALGESIAEGTVAKWLKKPGDRVDRDEALLEITTDKIDSEIPSPGEGVLSEIKAEEGTTVEVGEVLGLIDTEAEEGAGKDRPKEKTEPEKPAKAEESAEEESVEETGEEESEPTMTPVARNIAEEEGLSASEIEQIEGSGQRGKVTKSDILRYLEERPAKGPREEPEGERAVAPAKDRPAPEQPTSQTEESAEGRIEVIEMSNMRRMIAEHMVRSKQISPHTYTVAEVDMTRIVLFRESAKKRFQEENGFKLTYTPFVLHATVLALKAHPLVNSSVEDKRIIRKDFINLGIAVALDAGLIVPVIRNADEKNLLGLARAANSLAEKALQKKLSPDDVQGGTFTVTNPGVFGNIFGLPIINQPQLGILGVGAIKKRPVVIDDAIAIRSIMYLSLSYDHRVIDGALAARFIQKIRSILEDYDTDRAL